jgi:hypothetical protein
MAQGKEIMLRIKPSGRWLLVILCVLVSHLMAQSSTAAGQTREDPQYCKGIKQIRNLCSKAEIIIADKLQSDSLFDCIIDRSPNTGISFTRAGIKEINLRFVGRPPWVNHIKLAHSPNLSFKLQIRDVYGERRSIVFEKEEQLVNGDRSESLYRCKDTRLTFLIISPADNSDMHYELDSLMLYDVEAYFQANDPDDGEDFEVGIEWVKYYNGRPCDDHNLLYTKLDAQYLANKLVNKLGWTKNFEWGNGDAWASDFLINDENYADAVDLMYFSGHGTYGQFNFSHMSPGCQVHYGDCTRLWGNSDLEWMAISACRSLRQGWDHEVWDGWLGCFDGLHMILGWSTNSLDVIGGDDFGRQLAKKQRRVWASWSIAARKSHHAGWAANPRRVVALAQELDNFNDHVWEAGYVSDDYPPDNDYWFAYSEFSGWKNADYFTDRNEKSLTQIAVPDSKGPVILVPDGLLNKSRVDSMPCYNVVPRTVGLGYVEELAYEFCQKQGFFCTYDLEYDQDLGEYDLFDGPHELEVLDASGGWEYNQTETFCVPTSSPPTLPLTEQAQSQAEIFWTSFGILPSDAFQVDPSYMHIGMIDLISGLEVVDSSWNINIAASHIRIIDSFPVVGPGACLEMVFGDNANIQSAYFGGWRMVIHGGLIGTHPFIDALENVSASGPEITIGGLPSCDTFLIDTAILGYYEAGMDTIIDQLQPVWQVNGFCIEEGDTSAYQMLIPADYPAPKATIVSPQNNITIDYDTSILLVGSASQGTHPYQYDWYSHIDGHLGTGNYLPISGLSYCHKESFAAHHIIILEVTDANSGKDFESIEIRVLGPYICGDANRDHAVNVSDAVRIINYVFVGGDPPQPLESGDANCDGTCNVSDAVWIINYVFVGGNIPCDLSGDGIPDC